MSPEKTPESRARPVGCSPRCWQADGALPVLLSRHPLCQPYELPSVPPATTALRCSRHQPFQCGELGLGHGLDRRAGSSWFAASSTRGARLLAVGGKSFFFQILNGFKKIILIVWTGTSGPNYCYNEDCQRAGALFLDSESSAASGSRAALRLLASAVRCPHSAARTAARASCRCGAFVFPTSVRAVLRPPCVPVPGTLPAFTKPPPNPIETSFLRTSVRTWHICR